MSVGPTGYRLVAHILGGPRDRYFVVRSGCVNPVCSGYRRLLAPNIHMVHLKGFEPSLSRNMFLKHARLPVPPQVHLVS